ncbi:hypothetical protein PW52_11340 [Tamlana sedimentorum]|uniref:50S ribosomal protein L27 n=1 Tax=Neotamlana sedimentorum TaxID=1435349 RepID=A0A0D7W897_9FLAO|nr:hypothetical protein [Tamlana sedimentorum]KJD35259.1 hypothetical protein PW52_11340 [Tamlana sedimentorum]
MYSVLQSVHSYWAFLALIVLAIASINAIIKSFGDKTYEPNDFRKALFTLIVTHIQLLIGLILYFVSPRLQLFSELGMGGVMKDAVNRLYLVEHPFVNILAIALITIGYSKHKKKLTSQGKFKLIAIFYTLGLVLLLSRIPWSTWLG